MVKQVSLGESIGATLDILANPEKLDKLREDVFREENDVFIVDTCVAYDTHMWETCIFTQDRYMGGVIVEQYKNKEKAKAGHDKWVKVMENNPNQELKDCGVVGGFF